MDDVILIKIGKSYREDMSQEELYKATSVSWKISESKLNANTYKYYCAVYKNEIKEIYEIIGYSRDTHQDNEGRIILKGTIADEKLRNKLLGLDVKDIHIGKGNPIKYTSLEKLLMSVEDSIKAENVREDLEGYSSNINFNTDLRINNLVFEEKDTMLNQIKVALASGKNIIFIGPPGTGKSKLAKEVCQNYGITPVMATAASNWSTFETIGGYRPNKQGVLRFNPGIFLNCVKDRVTGAAKNSWLIIDEINRADIDKAFGSLFSVLTGDEVTLPFEAESGEEIVIRPQHDDEGSITSKSSEYVLPRDWRIVGTMNTLDKASLYEMSYAFMRRFAFIPVGVPEQITISLVSKYLAIWKMDSYNSIETLQFIWEKINNYRKVGPAIIKDIANYTNYNTDFTSAIILYVLPQFEGLMEYQIEEFTTEMCTLDVIDNKRLMAFVTDFFGVNF